MFSNYLVVALRNLGRRKSFAAINILGLSVAMASCLLITMYVREELSFDRYHAKADRIYRLVDDLKLQQFVEEVIVVRETSGT